MKPASSARSPSYGQFEEDGLSTSAKVFDRRYNALMVRVLPGDYYVTGSDQEMVVTVLGSCVAACVRNPFNGYGGLNHFMLPESDSGDWNGTSASMRYGNFAMETLINAVLKSGCRRADLEIKLFGGANFNAGPSMVGSKNAAFARDYLKAEGFKAVVEDLGGQFGRRIHYMPSTGKVQRLLLQDQTTRKLAVEEARYGSGLRQAPVEGDIELFD